MKDPSDDYSLVLQDEKAIKKPYGWIFFFASKRFLEGDKGCELYGNGPLVVLMDGRIEQLGTGHPVLERITEFETILKKRNLFYRILLRLPWNRN